MSAAVTTIPLAAPDGFRVVQREVEDGMGMIKYDVSISTSVTVSITAESLEYAELSGEIVKHAVRNLARRVIEQGEAVLR